MVKNSNSGIPIINIFDIPNNEFNISLPKDEIFPIFKNLKGDNCLFKKILKLKSQKNLKLGSIKRNFLCKWKKGDRIPIDCFLLFCKLSNKNALNYQRHIMELSIPRSKKSWKIKFPIKLHQDFFVISEAIRAEGCLMIGRQKDKLQGLAISNKDTFLLKLIENITIKLGISKKSICRILNVVLYFDKDPIIKEVLNLNSNKKMHFNYSNGRLFILDSFPNYNIKNKYKLIFDNNQQHIIQVYVKKNNLLKIKSDIHATGYLTLQVYNSTFANFLHHVFKIDYGIGNKKTYTIDFPFDINKLSKDTLKNIINIIISCEGYVSYKPKKNRNIVIKIASRKYLEKFQKILSRLGVYSKIWEKISISDGLFILWISRRKNLIKVNNLMDLYVKYKKINLRKAINSYSNNRFTHYEATENYLLMLYKHGPTDLKTLSGLTKKEYNTLISSFGRLDKQGFLKKHGKQHTGKGSTPWIYQLSKKGENFLKDSKPAFNSKT